MDADGIGASGAAGASGVAEVSLEPNSRAPPRLFPRAGADTRDPDGIEDEDDAVSVSNEGVPRPLAAPRAPLHAMRKFCGTLLAMASTQLSVFQRMWIMQIRCARLVRALSRHVDQKLCVPKCERPRPESI